jgi:hypothetical protein
MAQLLSVTILFYFIQEVHKMKKSILYSLMSLNLILLMGCETLKNIEDPLKEVSVSNKVTEEAIPGKEVDLYFFRPSLLLTAGQVVDLYINNTEVGEIRNGSHFETKTQSGNYEIATKVGLSIGLQGVCKFAQDFNLTKDSYYFKIDYDTGILCGEYEIIEISKADYNALAAE